MSLKRGDCIQSCFHRLTLSMVTPAQYWNPQKLVSSLRTGFSTAIRRFTTLRSPLEILMR